MSWPSIAVSKTEITSTYFLLYNCKHLMYSTTFVRYILGENILKRLCNDTTITSCALQSIKPIRKSNSALVSDYFKNRPYMWTNIEKMKQLFNTRAPDLTIRLLHHFYLKNTLRFHFIIDWMVTLPSKDYRFSLLVLIIIKQSNFTVYPTQHLLLLLS